MTSPLSKLRTYNRPTNGLAWVREAERLLAEAYEREPYCWHCQVVLIDDGGMRHPHCYNCPSHNECDEEDCSEPGCLGIPPRPVDAATREDADDKGPQHSTLCRFPNWSTEPVVRVEARDGALWFPDLIPDNRGPMAREEVVEAFDRWGETPDGWGKALRFLDFRCPPLPRADEPIEPSSRVVDFDTHHEPLVADRRVPARIRTTEQPSPPAKDSLTAEAGDALEMLQRYRMADVNGQAGYLLAMDAAVAQWQSERAQHAEEIARLKRELDRYKEVIAMIDGAAKGDSVGLLSRAEKAEARVRELELIRRSHKDELVQFHDVRREQSARITSLQSEVTRLAVALKEAEKHITSDHDWKHKLRRDAMLGEMLREKLAKVFRYGHGHAEDACVAVKGLLAEFKPDSRWTLPWRPAPKEPPSERGYYLIRYGSFNHEVYVLSPGDEFGPDISHICGPLPVAIPESGEETGE